MPIVDTERGFAVAELENNEGWSGGSKEKVLDYQAWHFVRQYMADMMHDVRLTVWYEWDGKDPWTGSAFALFNQKSPRPVYAAAQVMLAQLNGYNFVRRIDTGYELDYVLLFESEAGHKKLVAWTAPPAGETPDRAFPHEVRIAAGRSDGAQIVDVQGQDVAVEADGESVRIAVSGAPQYIAVPAGAEVAAKSIEPFKAPIATAAPPPAGAVDLKLFESGAEWEFVKNTGEGSFELGADGETPIGVLSYDFTRSKAKSTPYVLAGAKVAIPAGATEMRINARSPIAQKLTFRLIDDSGQTLQYKSKIRGSGDWETIRIPLTRKLEHWGGANDGKAHFPVKHVYFSVPLPDDEHKSGKVEYADAVAVMADGAGPADAETKPTAPGAAEPAKPLAGPMDLKLFATGAEWAFLKNTGEGSFELGKDGETPIGILSYDFAQSKASGTPYVLAGVATEIPAGAQELRINVRTSIKQRHTFRLVDASGQTLQFKTSLDGTGAWQTVRIPLTRKLEHWGGENDGKVHFPVKHLYLSVPFPGEDHKTGKLEYAAAIAE
jgi:hypothetical protein